MTTKPVNHSWGYTLEDQALYAAMYTREPNPRSPAFAVQAIFKVVKEAGVVCDTWKLRPDITEIVDAAIRNKVSWNKAKSCWQLGRGTHVSFKKIANDVIRWYTHDWDFARHTRDTETGYPEDREFLPWEAESEHLLNTFMPRADELTRRIVIIPGCRKFYYLDVMQHEGDMFIAEHGNFDDCQSYRRIGYPTDFWSLETKTILPFLKNLKVLSYTIHHISSRNGRGVI